MSGVAVHHAIAWALGADYRGYMMYPQAPWVQEMHKGVYITWFIHKEIHWAKATKRVLRTLGACALDPQWYSGTTTVSALLSEGPGGVYGVLDSGEHFHTEIGRVQAKGFVPTICTTLNFSPKGSTNPSFFVVHKTEQCPTVAEVPRYSRGSVTYEEITIANYLSELASKNRNAHKKH